MVGCLGDHIGGSGLIRWSGGRDQPLCVDTSMPQSVGKQRTDTGDGTPSAPYPHV